MTNEKKVFKKFMNHFYFLSKKEKSNVRPPHIIIIRKDTILTYRVMLIL